MKGSQLWLLVEGQMTMAEAHGKVRLLTSCVQHRAKSWVRQWVSVAPSTMVKEIDRSWELPGQLDELKGQLQIQRPSAK